MQLSLSVKSQGIYYNVGYGVLYAPFSELNKMVYLGNVNNGASKKMGNFHFATGINLGAGIYGDGIGIEVRLSNYQTKKESEFTEGGQEYIQKLKFRWRSYSLNYLFGETYIFGFGTNLGTLKFYGKKYLKSEEEPDYEELTSSSLLLRSVGGVNLIGEVPITSFLRMRLTYYLNFTGKTEKVSSFLNTGITSFPPEIGMNSLTLDLYFRFGRN